ncbi:alkyl sulfatase dimerization domain-containing protein [Sphingomonas sp. MMS24-JH45]
MCWNCRRASDDTRGRKRDAAIVAVGGGDRGRSRRRPDGGPEGGRGLCVARLRRDAQGPGDPQPRRHAGVEPRRLRLRARREGSGDGRPELVAACGCWRSTELFRVTDRIWQVRGFDLANLTFVKGDKGWIVIDVGSTRETARGGAGAGGRAAGGAAGQRGGHHAFAQRPFRRHRRDRRARGPAGRTVPILAPQGFFAHSVSENVIAGPAMQRRATYQFGTGLGIGPRASMGSGIGPALPGGARALPRPTREIATDGEEVTVDGVRLRFQLTPGTEAPAEMNVAFPDWRVIDMAENANVTQHNILTPRGAQVRDARAWAQGLTRAIEANPDAEVMVTSHGWPRFGKAAVRDFLEKHRDAYAYLHDQTVRWMNKGLTGDEIADADRAAARAGERIGTPPDHGLLSFNARAVYQFYLGWYDCNPAHLAAMAPADAGRRYVAALGGPAKVVALAQGAIAARDDAWAAELLNRLVMAGEAGPARELLARYYERMGFAAENSLWRNMLSRRRATCERASPSTCRRAGRARWRQICRRTNLFALLAVRLDPAKAGRSGCGSPSTCAIRPSASW